MSEIWGSHTTYKINANVNKQMIEDLSKQHGIDAVQLIEKELVLKLSNFKRIEKIEKLLYSNAKNKKS